MAALVMAAGLAALMSTMDSQLLTLSSIFTRDIIPLLKPGKKPTGMTGRIFVLCLSIAGLALAYKPPATILQIATQTFTGLAVLFPTVLFGLYFKRVYSLSGILSILCGETALLGFYFKFFPKGAFLPVIWVMITAFAVYLATHSILLWRDKALQFRKPDWLSSPYFYILALIFIAAMDFWAWGSIKPLFLGVPLWMGYFVLLSAIQTIVMAKLIKSK